MNKENLKDYMTRYGELDFFKDLTSILKDLREEWEPVNADISKKLDSATLCIATAAFLLEEAEKQHQRAEPLEPQSVSIELLDSKKAIEEYSELQKFFADKSFKDFRKYYKNHQEEILIKLNRMKVLKDAITQINQK